LTFEKIALTKAEYICFKILSVLNSQGKVLKWELIKILGNETAFRRWLDNNLIRYGLVKCDEEKIGKREFRYYMKTRRGEILHKLLLDYSIVKATRRIIGRDRLRI